MAIAQRRGSRHLAVEDFVFLLRKDRFKVRKLTDFLSWKDVRKNIRSSGNASGDRSDELLLSGASPSVGSGFGDDVEKALVAAAAAANGNAPVAPRAVTCRRRRTQFSWDFVEQLVADERLSDGADSDDGPSEERPSADDAEDVLLLSDELQFRLREEDELTKAMSRDEYIEYAECRQASFVFKKAKKFREWLNLGRFVDSKPNDDVIEILGYLAWENVRRLAEFALRVKDSQERYDAAHVVVRPVTLQSLLLMPATAWNNAPWTALPHVSSGTRDGRPAAAHFASFSVGLIKHPDSRTQITRDHVFEACRLLSFNAGDAATSRLKRRGRNAIFI